MKNTSNTTPTVQHTTHDAKTSYLYNTLRKCNLRINIHTSTSKVFPQSYVPRIADRVSIQDALEKGMLRTKHPRRPKHLRPTTELPKAYHRTPATILQEDSNFFRQGCQGQIIHARERCTALVWRYERYIYQLSKGTSYFPRSFDVLIDVQKRLRCKQGCPGRSGTCDDLLAEKRGQNGSTLFHWLREVTEFTWCIVDNLVTRTEPSHGLSGVKWTRDSWEYLK